MGLGDEFAVDRQACEAERYGKRGEARAQGTVERHPADADRHIDAVVGARNVDLGAGVFGQDGRERYTQLCHEREKVRMQDMAFGHVDDVVAAALLESDHDRAFH